MAKVIAKIKKQYLEFSKKEWPPYHAKNVTVEIVEAKRKVGRSNNYSPTHNQLTYTDFFKVKHKGDKRVVRKILIEGYGGSGKTVLCTSLCVDWANGVILQQFKLVLFLPLYHDKVVSAGSLSNLLKLLFPIQREQIAIRKIFENKIDKVLIIADGWNHLDPDERQNGSFIYQLLFGHEWLPQVSVLVTSRPSSSVPLHDLQCIDQVLEIHGFDENSIRQYINFVLATDKASHLLNQLQHNEAAKMLCCIPLNCAILSHLWYSFGIKIVPETMTELYTIFASNMIVNMVNSNVCNVQSCLAALPGDIQKHFWNCCEFAFQAIEKNRIIFSQHDVVIHFPQSSDDTKPCFGLLQPLDLPAEASTSEASFQFLHPVLMEYLAALHLTQQDVTTQLEVCESHTVSMADYDNVWKFYFGLMRHSQNKLANFQAIQILSQKVSHKLYLCHYAYEADCHLVNLIAANELCGQFSFSSVHPHTAYDCFAVAHVLANTQDLTCSEVQISFNNCGLTDVHLVHLTNKLDQSKMSTWRQKIKKLHLLGNVLTHTGINKILGRSMPTYYLTHLDLSYNFMGVKGLQVLEDVMHEDILKCIQNLTLQNCLTCDPDINGALLATFLEAVFTHCHQLCCLNLSGNNLGIPGAQSLQQASILSQPHLSLFLNRTALGDEGLRAFAQGDWNLDELDLQGNSLHAKGILSLSKSISSGKCGVRYLVLDDNSLRLKGSRAVGVMLSGSSHSKLRTVSLARCKLTHVDSNHSKKRDVAVQLFQARRNNNIIELHVDENDFAGESMCILAGFLHLCPKLEFFYSTHCGISSKDIMYLVDLLPSLQLGWSEMKFWQLDHNMIDDSAVPECLAIVILRMSVSLDNNLISKEMAKKMWMGKWNTIFYTLYVLASHKLPTLRRRPQVGRSLPNKSFVQEKPVLKQLYIKPKQLKQKQSEQRKESNYVGNSRVKDISREPSLHEHSTNSQDPSESQLQGSKSAVGEQINPLDKVVNDYHIAEVAQNLKDWEEISPSINLSESERKEIKEDYQGRYSLQKRQALRVWRNKSDDKATYRELLSIFQSQGLAELGELVEKMASAMTQSPISGYVINKFNRYLLDCYHDLLYPPMQQLSSPELLFQHQYTELALRQAPIAIIGNQKPTDSRLVELSAVLSSKSEKLVVLFEGVGGSGKTALSWHICRKWAKKELLQQFHLLIHVQVRDPQIQSAKCLPDIIPDPDKKIRQEVATAIYDQNGKGVCFLLDGLDEASISFLDTLFDMIIGRQRNRTPQISFIMTTRPNMHIASRLQPVLKFKIILEGFSSAKLHEFLKRALDHKHSPHYLTLLDKFKANPQLEWVCAHPINAVIIAFLAHEFEGDLPATQTGLYRAFVFNFLNRHVQIRPAGDYEMIDSFDSLPPDLKQSFNKLCEWAYKASLSKKRLFTAKELGEASVEFDNTLGLLQIQPKITMYGTERYYSFTHSSIQEFFAAVHISLQPDKCHSKLVQQLLKEVPLNNAIPFYAGLTGLSNPEVINLLSEALKHPLHGLNTLAALRADSAESNDPRRKMLALFNCFYECQNESLLKRPDMQFPQCWESFVNDLTLMDKMGIKARYDNMHIVSLMGLGLTPSDCIAIGHFMRMNTFFVKQKTLIWFEMGICSDTGMTSFIKEFRKGVETKTPTQLLVRLAYSTLGTASLLAFKNLLRGQSNISALHVTSCINPENVSTALKSIIEGLADNSSCSGINLSTIAIQSIHVHYLVLLLLVSSSFINLMIGGGNLQNHKTMSLFSEAIKISTLKSLNLSDCSIDDTGIYLLGKGISANMFLTELVIPGNPITVSGMMKFLMFFISTSSPFIGLTIDDHVFYELEQLPEYQTLLGMLNYVRQKQGRMGFVVLPFSFAHAMATANKPVINVYDEAVANKLISRTHAV